MNFFVRDLFYISISAARRRGGIMDGERDQTKNMFKWVLFDFVVNQILHNTMKLVKLIWFYHSY